VAHSERLLPTKPENRGRGRHCEQNRSIINGVLWRHGQSYEFNRDADGLPVKRTLDLILALTLLPPAALLSILFALPIWIETRANPLFVQVRVGRQQRPFRLMKLRTMRSDTLHRASHEIGAAQITRSGRFLRSSKLDELPQIWNVLSGTMSFVGPRPCLPSQHQLIAERERLGVHALRPGITGPAQVAGIDMSTPARLAQADAVYLNGWSLTGDLRLLMQTVLGGGRGDAANRT
jgi:lipopolysaccharide/colanic/teichoic acid biosynthesis glycosyltransferase